MELREEEQLVNAVRSAKDDFGHNYPKKFGGAVAVEILRRKLQCCSIASSRRDVFVRDVPVETDLVIPYAGERPLMELLYEPHQVAVALEVKKSGIFGARGIQAIRRSFNLLREKGVCCAYFTFEDMKGYKFAGTPESLGCRCFTMAWHKTSEGPFEPTEEWKAFVDFLRERLEARDRGRAARACRAAPECPRR
jgi:hypothetical protein